MDDQQTQRSGRRLPSSGASAQREDTKTAQRAWHVRWWIGGLIGLLILAWCRRRYDDYVRWMYRSGRPHRWARWQNRASALAFAVGILPQRAASLEVRGRRSGRLIAVPVVIAAYEGERYLVAMLGERANWVRNVRAADGRAVLCHGHREAVCLEEVAVKLRPPILRCYLALAPGARPHIPIPREPRSKTSHRSPHTSPSSAS